MWLTQKVNLYRRLVEVIKSMTYRTSRSSGWWYVQHLECRPILIRTSFVSQANVEDIVAVDTKYLYSLLGPTASWGAQAPHEYVYPSHFDERPWSFTHFLAQGQAFFS